MNLLGPILAIFSLATAIGAKLEKVSIEGPGNTSAQVENRFVSPPGGILPKTIVSSKLRLVFLVGLEGSAHHYLLNAFEHFFPDEGGIKAQQKGCQVMYESLEVQHSMKTSPSFYMKNIEEARGRIRTLAEHASSLSPEEAVATLCGMFSYPRNVGIYKVFQYIDLGALADLAEEEGIDLRVIYLKRPAKDIVISTTVHRHFQTGLGPTGKKESFMMYMRILMTNIAVMRSFLAGLDPAFVVCHDFDYLGDVDQARKIAEHVIPRENLTEKFVASLLATAPTSRSKEESLALEGADFVVSRLQRHLDSFEFEYCG